MGIDMYKCFALFILWLVAAESAADPDCQGLDLYEYGNEICLLSTTGDDFAEVMRSLYQRIDELIASDNQYGSYESLKSTVEKYVSTSLEHGVAACDFMDYHRVHPDYRGSGSSKLQASCNAVFLNELLVEMKLLLWRCSIDTNQYPAGVPCFNEFAPPKIKNDS